MQIGGGLVVTFAGWRILNRRSDLSERQPESPPRQPGNTVASVLSADHAADGGPGSIAVALTLGSNLHEETHLQLIVSALTAVIGILLIGLSIFLCYWFSEGLQRLFGPTGTSMLIRLSAFIVVCIGIQIIFNGLEDFYRVLRGVAH